jgi:hypothetical protein
MVDTVTEFAILDMEGTLLFACPPNPDGIVRGCRYDVYRDREQLQTHN